MNSMQYLGFYNFNLKGYFFSITAPHKCPAGYVKYQLSKSFEPLQLLSEGLEQKIVQSTNPSIDQCATECSQEDTCCIFEYKFDVQNMVASTCKLLTDCEVEAAQYNYPIFCKKSKYRISLFFSTSTYTKDPSKFNDSKIILL